MCVLIHYYIRSFESVTSHRRLSSKLLLSRHRDLLFTITYVCVKPRELKVSLTWFDPCSGPYNLSNESYTNLEGLCWGVWESSEWYTHLHASLIFTAVVATNHILMFKFCYSYKMHLFLRPVIIIQCNSQKWFEKISFERVECMRNIRINRCSKLS